MKSLRSVQTTLLAALGNEALFSLVNTRLILRTGVDLRAISSAEDNDPAVLSKVLQALTALGFPPSQLELIIATKARGP